MAKALTKYIKEYLDQGYDVNTVRSHLISSGYKENEIDKAINQLYSTKHVVHHLSKTTIITLAAVLLAIIIITGSILIYLKPSEAILDIKLEPVTTTIKPGEDVVFIRELTNFGKKVDVTTSYSIISVDTAQVITTYQETAAVETKASKQIKIKIPNDAALGNHILSAIATYKEQEARAALAMKIYQESSTPTCTDNIQNQDETKVDCGGLCSPCQEEKKCPTNCNDHDECTEDSCNKQTNFECKNKPISPCCGNNICEENEDPKSCNDCIEELPNIFEGLTPLETLDKIKEIAETDVKKAANYCSAITIETYKDSCFENIAEVTQNILFCDKITLELSKDRCYAKLAKEKSDSSACDSINKDSRRDSCYMTFVLEYKDYSVCDKIVNKYLRDSCQTLNQMKAA